MPLRFVLLGWCAQAVSADWTQGRQAGSKLIINSDCTGRQTGRRQRAASTWVDDWVEGG
jgi:hypothetical protein